MENVVYTQWETSPPQEEWRPLICRKVDRNGDHYAERQVPRDLTHVWMGWGFLTLCRGGTDGHTREQNPLDSHRGHSGVQGEVRWKQGCPCFSGTLEQGTLGSMHLGTAFTPLR